MVVVAAVKYWQYSTGSITTTSSSLLRMEYYNSTGADGAFYGGGFLLLGKQAACSVATCTTSFSLTWLIGKVRL